MHKNELNKIEKAVTSALSSCQLIQLTVIKFVQKGLVLFSYQCLIISRILPSILINVKDDQQTTITASLVRRCFLGWVLQSSPFIVDTLGTSIQCPHQQESVIAGVYFSQMSVIYFWTGIQLLSVLSGCPLQRAVRRARADCKCSFIKSQSL